MLLRGHHLHRPPLTLAGLMVLTAALQVGATAGLAYIAGFADVWQAMQRFNPWWLLPLLAALGLAFVGYFQAYHGIYAVERGPRLAQAELLPVVVAAFGGFLSLGAAALDIYALEAAGATRRNATVRTAALAGLEQGLLAVCGCVGAVVLLVAGTRVPTDVTWPWALGPIPGFALAFWLAERYRGRVRQRTGWRGGLGVFLDCIHLIRVMFAQPRRYGAALLGMVIFWLAEAGAAWSGVAAFGFRMGGAAFLVGFATGSVFTRRTGPLAGAGFMVFILPLTIWYCGAPFTPVLLGVFTYRMLAVWLPMPLTLAQVGRLRRIGAGASPPAGPAGRTRPPRRAAYIGRADELR